MSDQPSGIVERTREYVIRPLRVFLHTEASGGIFLLAATVAALVWANGPWRDTYDTVWHAHLTIGFGDFAITEDIQHWINDALMAIFFFLVGLEIKRELVAGDLNDPRTAFLPTAAAFGGMVGPALIYAALNFGGPGSSGWGIPMATDIAFVVGLLAVLGRRIPSKLKLFLLTLAIVDDIGAILVIAVFYTEDLSLLWLAGAVGGLLALVGMRAVGVAHPLAYVPVALGIWLATYESGIHPTIAGVALGLMTPAHRVNGRPVLEELEHRLHPWSSYLIVPLFALANAGVQLSVGEMTDAFASRVFWGVAAGLLVGKTLGITAAAAAAVKLGWGRLPSGVGWRHLIGGASLAGIGFTVALFITALAFTDQQLVSTAKIGVLVGSLVSAVVGSLVLARSAVIKEPVPAAAIEPPERPYDE